MFLCGWLALVTLIPVILSTNPGVEIKVTDKGLEYGEPKGRQFLFGFWLQVALLCHPVVLSFVGRQLGMAAIHEKLKGVRLPDFSGSRRVSLIGKVKYSLSK